MLLNGQDGQPGWGAFFHYPCSSIACWRCLGSVVQSCVAVATCFCCLSRLISAFAHCCFWMMSKVILCCCRRMRLARGAVTFWEEVNSWAAVSIGFVRPRPPRRVGRAKRSLSAVVTQLLPVRAGMKWRLIASSRGCSTSEVSGMVQRKYIHLIAKPCVKAE